MEAVQIGKSALDVEWRRLELIAENLANMSSTRGPEGEVYHAQRLVSGPASSFAGAMSATDALSGAPTTASLAPTGVVVLGVESDSAPPRRVYEPGHPHADADGFVEYPNIDHAEQMMQMMRSARIYEANLTALTLAQQM
ncbi:MAG: flagellar basal-body rod protein FlgC, partial [Alphaproteobacteria bacterium]